jgi:cellobiose-specific phosphotransferase system component IIA
VFAVESDRRRKYTLRRAEQELNTAHQFLDNIITAFNIGNKTHLDCLLLAAREYHSGQATQDAITITRDAEQVWGHQTPL